MRPKFKASLAPHNSVKIFSAETGSLLKTITVEGTATTQPVIVGSELTLEVKKEGKLYKNIYNLPHGSLKTSDLLED
ncbi:MAG: hypothetical protein EBU90_20010 [Proteobacteria bacterium]|nr:hypothetical protein [Pseudomonadota bacterium]